MFKSSAIALVVCGITGAAQAASVASIFRFHPIRANPPAGYVSSPVGNGVFENPDIRGHVVVRYHSTLETSSIDVNVENLLPNTMYGVKVESTGGLTPGAGESNPVAIFTDSDGTGTYSRSNILQDAATGAQVTIYIWDGVSDPIELTADEIRAVAILIRSTGQ